MQSKTGGGEVDLVEYCYKNIRAYTQLGMCVCDSKPNTLAVTYFN